MLLCPGGAVAPYQEKDKCVNKIRGLFIIGVMRAAPLKNREWPGNDHA